MIYSNIQKGYKCYDPKKCKFYLNIDVTFDECMIYNTTKGNLTMEDRMESDQNLRRRPFILSRKEISLLTTFKQLVQTNVY